MSRFKDCDLQDNVGIKLIDNYVRWLYNNII